MSGSIREIDAVASSSRYLPLPRRDAAAYRQEAAPPQTAVARTDLATLSPTESLALNVSSGTVLPRYRRALTVYRQNSDARRVLYSGPFFVDTYA